MTIRVLGQGPPLVLVPGIASTYRIYAILLNRLGERFTTIQYDYPGDDRDDRANLAKIALPDLVDDLFGLLEHLKTTQSALVGVSFGSTVVLRAMHRNRRRFPRAALIGGFAHRSLSVMERLALLVASRVPGHVQRLPFREAILTYNSKLDFPGAVVDRFPFYLEQNGLTPIRSLAHRCRLLTSLDLRSILPEIMSEVLLIHGNDDRIVARSQFDLLKSSLPAADSVILPAVGHQAPLTHPDVLARLVGDWLLPSPAEVR
jgi:pimeloyl-ACP methyl ester carboxylesterase